MLRLELPENELYDPRTNRFIDIPACTLNLEHSLISIAKWESTWHIPYLSESKRTREQEMDYIRCMIIGTIPDQNIINSIINSGEHLLTIEGYINNPMTATTFSKAQTTSKLKREVVTAEIIYARMFEHGISIECQKWHLNRLLTLLRVCDLRSSPSTKMSKRESARWAAEQNAARRAKYNTRG